MATSSKSGGWHVSVVDYLVQRHPELFPESEHAEEVVTGILNEAPRDTLVEIIKRLRVRTNDIHATTAVDVLTNDTEPPEEPKPKTLQKIVKAELAERHGYKGKRLDSKAGTLVRLYRNDSVIISATEVKRSEIRTRTTITDYETVEARVQGLLDGKPVKYFELKEVIREVALSKGWKKKKIDSELRALSRKYKSDAVISDSSKLEVRGKWRRILVTDYTNAKERIGELIDGAEIVPVPKKPGRKPKEEKVSYYSALEPLVEEETGFSGQKLRNKTTYLCGKFYEDAIVREYTKEEVSGRGRRIWATDLGGLGGRLAELMDGAEIQTTAKKGDGRLTYRSAVESAVVRKFDCSGKKLFNKTTYSVQKYIQDREIRRCVLIEPEGERMRRYVRGGCLDALTTRLIDLIDGAEIIAIKPSELDKNGNLIVTETPPVERELVIDGRHYDPDNRATFSSVLKPMVAEKYGIESHALVMRTRKLMGKFIHDGIVSMYADICGGEKRKWVYVTPDDALIARLNKLVNGATVVPLSDTEAPVDITLNKDRLASELDTSLGAIVSGSKRESSYTPPERITVWEEDDLKLYDNKKYSKRDVTEVLRKVHQGYFSDVVIGRVMEDIGTAGYVPGSELISLVQKTFGMMILSGGTKRELADTLQVAVDDIDVLVKDEVCQPYVHLLPYSSTLFFMKKDKAGLVEAMRNALYSSATDGDMVRTIQLAASYKRKVCETLKPSPGEYSALKRAGVLKDNSPGAVQRTHERLIKLMAGKYDFSFDFERLRNVMKISHDEFFRGPFQALKKAGLAVDVVELTGGRSSMHVYAVAAGTMREDVHKCLS